MGIAVTPEQAFETYNRTVRDEPRYNWAAWVTAISNSLAAGGWIGGNGYPDYVKEAYELTKQQTKISYADENDRP